MFRILTALFLLLSLPAFRAAAQQPDEAAIRAVLQAQAEAWNKGNIVAYMDGYWKNDSLLFIGKAGPTYGHRATLERYRKAYPDAAAMGQLTFSEVSIRLLSDHSAFVVGKWSLKRDRDNPGGYFTLLWERRDGKWVIVADHSS